MLGVALRAMKLLATPSPDAWPHTAYALRAEELLELRVPKVDVAPLDVGRLL